MLLPILGLLAFYGWNWLHGGEPPRETWQEFEKAGGAKSAVRIDPAPEAPVAEPAPPAAKTTAAAATPSPAATRADGPGDIVLIIDDLGFEGQPLERVMALDPNINGSVLPNGNRAAKVASTLHERGFEVLCHLPMQPRGDENPGAGTILTPMSDAEIAELTRRNIEAVPHARGVNNHMGSLATADRRVMASVIGAMPAGLYFIDSRTASGSVAADVSRELKVPTAARDVFLDDVPSYAAIRRQLEELAETASRRGVAIGIGHPRDSTLDVLEQEIPKLKARGFRFIRASTVVR